MIAFGQRLSGKSRCNGKGPHLHLHPYDRQPEKTRDDVEQDRQHDPTFQEGLPCVPCQRYPRNRLRGNGCCCEQEIRDDDEAGD